MSLMFIILMGDYTWRQYSIDSWHKNADRIYLTGNEKMFYMWPLAAEEIKNQCESDYRLRMLTDRLGVDLDDYILDDITDAYEWSFVAVPAQVNAGVTKRFTDSERVYSAHQ